MLYIYYQRHHSNDAFQTSTKHSIVSMVTPKGLALLKNSQTLQNRMANLYLLLCSEVSNLISEFRFQAMHVYQWIMNLNYIFKIIFLIILAIITKLFRTFKYSFGFGSDLFGLGSFFVTDFWIRNLSLIHLFINFGSRLAQISVSPIWVQISV